MEIQSQIKNPIATLSTLERLHNWFYSLCKYEDSEAWMDRMYAEGSIYACREILNDFETRFREMSRGFKFQPDNEWFMKGYNNFKEKYCNDR
jgi:hypothetical protein